MKFLDGAPRFLFFTGKGGVGKTSIACATAIRLAEAGRRVLLVSTDPASNVGQVFGIEIGDRITAIAAVPGLFALEIDPEAAAQAYRDRIVGPVRGRLPEVVVKGIEEQLSGACATEIAAFDEFTGLLVASDLTSAYDHIIFDTAPTGHTLLLLDATGAYHREAARMLDPKGAHYTTAMMRLQDGKRTKVLIVTLAETTPVLEAARLQADLRRAGIEPWAWVVNNSVAAARPRSPLLRKRARNELAEVEKVATSHARRYAVAPLPEEEPVGVERLLTLAAPVAQPA